MIFAVPGRIDQPSSAGCHLLIRDGATLFTSVDDILNELNYLDGLRPQAIAAPAGTPSVLEQLLPQLSEEERRVLGCFAGGSTPRCRRLGDSDRARRAPGVGGVDDARAEEVRDETQ